MGKFETDDDASSSKQNPPTIAIPDSFWRLRFPDQSSSKMPKLLRRAFNSTVKPMKWAAAEQERAGKCLDDLKDLNESLTFVSGTLSSRKANMLPSRMLAHVWEESNLQILIEATTQHEPEIARCAELKKEVLAAMRADLLAQKRGNVIKSSLKLLPPKVTKRCKTNGSHLMTAEYSNQDTGKLELVLLENKGYANGQNPQYETFVENRVREVAAILAKSPKPARLQILDCIGYVQNRIDKSFSFVFRFPADAAKDVEPISLQRLLPNGPNGWFERQKKNVTSRLSDTVSKPALSMRFAMAQSLSQSLGLLQACGVLHKGIAPANIVFFAKARSGNAKDQGHDLSHPVIVGFSWARLHGPEYVSDATANANTNFTSSSGQLHMHPTYTGKTDQRYLKIFDVYSLGLVFLQIGLWRSLADIADELFPSAKSMINKTGHQLDGALEVGESDEWLKTKILDWQSQLVEKHQVVAQPDGIAAQVNPRWAFQEALVANIERLLLPEAGQIYTRVVARCLTGDLSNDEMPRNIVDKKSDENEPEYILQDAIVKGVVQELEKCNV